MDARQKFSGMTFRKKNPTFTKCPAVNPKINAEKIVFEKTSHSGEGRNLF